MRKRATAKEVALAAGVSKWTVIRAFTEGASITLESRAKVLDAARLLNYSPNLLARSLATNLTHQVAVFIDDFTNPHKLPFLERLTENLQSEGLVAVLININSQFDHVNALINADQRQVDAVILGGTSFRDETLSDIRLRAGFPPVFVLARDSQIENVPAINCDTGFAMQEMCAHLMSKPYKRPAFMSGPKALSTSLGRFRLFRDMWREKRGMEVQEIQVDAYSAFASAAAMRDYLARTAPEERMDLIMCENDILACGVIDVIRHELGLRVPEDMAVAGFDGIELAGTATYDLTTYEQPNDEMAKAIVAMILNRRPKESIDLKGRLIIRKSA